MESSLSKVVVRKQDGEVIHGFAGERMLDKDVRILDRKGKERSFELADLKAVFFVHDFEGDPDYQDLRFLGKQEPSSMVWVRIEFQDGEVLEGKVRNNIDLLSSHGLYVWPSDQETNNKRTFVVRRAIKSFAFLCNP